MVLAGKKPPYFVTCLTVPDTAGLIHSGPTSSACRASRCGSG